MSSPPVRPATLAYLTMLIVQLLESRWYHSACRVEFVDPLEIHEEQPPRGLRRNGQVVEEHFLVAVVGAQADQVALFADDVDEFVLLEHRRQRRIAFVRLGPRLDRDAERRSVVEHEAQERVPDGAFHPERHVEVHAGQMRQRHFALLVARREVVPAPIVEIANAGDAHAVAVDDGVRHHRDVAAPIAVVRWQDGGPPRAHDEKEPREHPAHARPARDPQRPDAEGRERHRQCQPQPRPRQVRIVDRQRRPDQQHRSADMRDPADQGAQRAHDATCQRRCRAVFSAVHGRALCDARSKRILACAHGLARIGAAGSSDGYRVLRPLQFPPKDAHDGYRDTGGDRRDAVRRRVRRVRRAAGAAVDAGHAVPERARLRWQERHAVRADQRARQGADHRAHFRGTCRDRARRARHGHRRQRPHADARPHRRSLAHDAGAADAGRGDRRRCRLHQPARRRRGRPTR